MVDAAKRRVTYAEYLALEATSEVKHEYIDGAIDRRSKSLREYILVTQRERRVDVFRRAGRTWQLDEYGRGESFTLTSIGIELSIDEIYVDELGPIIAS